MATIFISHSSVDEKLARELGKWLQASGFDDVFVDLSIRGGDKWPEALRAAKASCRVVLCLVTPSWLASPECDGEFSAAWYMGRRIIPLVALSGATLDPAQERRRARVLGEDQGFDITNAIEADGRLDLDGHPGIAEPLRAGLRAGGALAKVGLDPEAFEVDRAKRPAPFPGLESFGDDDADAAVFFGRSPEIAELLERLREMRASGELKPLVVLGASGSGKSSLVKAGVLPRLRRERAWLVVRSFRPGADPLYNFADAIARTFADYGATRAAGPIRNALRDAWRAAARQGQRERREGFATDDGLIGINEVLTSILDELRRVSGRRNATALLALDQGEEIARGEGESSDALCDVLRAALLPGRVPVEGDALPAGCRLILSCRTDSFAELQSAPRFDGLECISADIRAVPIYRYDNAVEGPAARYGVQIEYALVEALMEDSPGEDALPLLAFALERLWRQFAAERRIRKDYYDSLGKLDGLIEDAAERALRGIKPGEEIPIASLSADKDALGARTFVPALAQVSDRGSTIRRVAPWAAFDASARDLLELFASWRLVVKKGEDDSTVEVAHETIFRAWRRFTAWLEPEKARLEALRGVETAARTWDRGGQRGDDLTHRKRRLKEARALGRHPDFSKLIEKSDAPVQAYLTACGGAEFRRGLLAGTGVSALLVAVVGGVLWSNEMRWRGQLDARASVVRPPTRTDAVALSIAAVNPPGAVLGLLGADDSSVMESLGLRVPGRDLGRVSDGYLSANGEWLLTRNYAPDGTYQGKLWPLRDEGAEPRDLGTLVGDFTSYSDDGRWLLTRSYGNDGIYRGRLTDLQGEEEPRDLGPVDYWWFSPDGAWIVTTGYTQNVYETRLWDLSLGDEPVDLGDIDTSAIYFTADSAWLFYREYLADGGSSGRLRALRKGGASRDLGPVDSHQVSADGTWLITTGYTVDGVYGSKLWDLRTGAEARDLGDIDPYGMTLSANGEWLYASRWNGVAYDGMLMPLHEGGKPRAFDDLYADPTRVVDAWQFADNGDWLIVRGSSVQTYSAQLVNMADDGAAVDLGSVDLYSTQFSADGRWLYTRSVDPDGATQGTLRDLRDPSGSTTIENVETWQASADGSFLVTTTVRSDGSYESLLWDQRSGAAPRDLGPGDLYSFQFTPDGKTLIAAIPQADGSYAVSVLDLEGDGAWRDLGSATTWLFSPVGGWLITGRSTPEGAFENFAWNLRDGGEPIALGDIDTYSAQYSADETRLFANSYAGEGGITGFIWDLRTGVMSQPVGSAETVYLSPDGTWLVAGGYAPDGTYQGALHNLTDGSVTPLDQLDAYGVAFSPDGGWLLTRSYAADGLAYGQLWNLRDGAAPIDLGQAQSWQFSADGAWLSISGYDVNGVYRAQVLDLGAGGAEYGLGEAWGGEVLGFSTAGRWMITREYLEDGSYGGRLRDLQQGGEPVDLGQTDYWQFSLNDAWLMVSGYALDGSYQSQVFSLEGENEPLSLGGVDSYSTQFLGEGDWLFARAYTLDGSYQGYLWNLREGGDPLDMGAAESVQMSADGAWLYNLAASPVSHWGQIYDLRSGGDPRDLGSLGYSLISPNGDWLLAGGAPDINGRAKVELLDLRQGGEPRDLGEVDTFLAQYSADGSWLFLRTYEADGSLKGRLWNLRDGGEPRELGAVESPTFSADGAWLFTREYAADGTYRGWLWDLRAGGEPRELGAVESVTMSADGSQILTFTTPFGGNYDGRLWNLEAPVIEGEGVELRKAACEASRMLPLSRTAREDDRRLQGRPWHPCDWRGLMPTIEDGWEGARQWTRMIRVRLGLAEDYACVEANAAGETNALRAQLCREIGEAAAPEAPPAPSLTESAGGAVQQGQG